VTRYRTQPPWDFLLSASRTSLQSYELTRLSHAANLRKEIGALLDQWMDENACAMLARWLMEYHDRIAAQDVAATTTPDVASSDASESENFIVEQSLPPPIARSAA
jgi:hypothetical protein